MDATAAEILVQGGDSVAATRRSSRPVTPTAKLREKLQTAEKKTNVARKMGPQKFREGENEDKDGFADSAEVQMMEGAMGKHASLMQIMFQAMLQETSGHIMSEQKKMLV
ncbi:hypothetical protein NW764_016287 [Fusarium oxysporum]|nr:hypothetical protein NW764_016287 [Fusarium oxysporum]